METTAQTPAPRNIAETLAEVLPEAKVVSTIETQIEGLTIAHVAVPKASVLQEVRIDLEALLPNPRRTKATARFSAVPSFLAYVERHATPGSAVWCTFDPQSFALDFTAVFDEHEKGKPGWRAHRATLVPEMSAEWKAWKGKNTTSMPQVTFAEWIQEHEDDITSNANGLPTSLQMHAMATEFVANEERVLKSTVKLQSGGVRLTYIADPDAGTTETMQMFERFAIGIPVFHGSAAWALTARLKYRLSAGKVNFHYELVRPDRVHDGAAKELIEEVRAGLGAMPMFMGACA
jgi:uncharacterized protein YfdQ (DUF2303 family)